MEDRASAEVAAEQPLFRCGAAMGEAGFANCLFPSRTSAQWLCGRGATASPCSAQQECVTGEVALAQRSKGGV